MTITVCFWWNRVAFGGPIPLLVHPEVSSVCAEMHLTNGLIYTVESFRFSLIAQILLIKYASTKPPLTFEIG